MGTESEENTSIDKFINSIRSFEQQRSHNLAVRTVKFLKSLIQGTSNHQADKLLTLVSDVGRKIALKCPHQTTVENMVHRVLKIIRDEYVAGQKDKQDEVDQQESLHKILTSETAQEDYRKAVPDLKAAILEHMEEFEMELDTAAGNMAAQASEHIHSNEMIMTIGHSTSVEAFLKHAAKTRQFEVVVAECAPTCHGREMAARLGESKIQTTLISDAAIFAMMSRVNKVIIGTHAVMANGGLRAICGTHTLALAAKHCSVPVFVLAPMYKLSRHYPSLSEQHTFSVLRAPEGVLSCSDGPLAAQCHVYNPVFDYVPPELVTLFISNVGGHAPSYVYRLISELYHPQDSDLAMH